MCLWARRASVIRDRRADVKLPVGRGPGLAYGSRDISNSQVRLGELECPGSNGRTESEAAGIPVHAGVLAAKDNTRAGDTIPPHRRHSAPVLKEVGVAIYLGDGVSRFHRPAREAGRAGTAGHCFVHLVSLGLSSPSQRPLRIRALTQKTLASRLIGRHPDP